MFAEGAFALSPETMALLKADMQYDWNYPWRFASDYDLGGRIAGLYEAALAVLFEPSRLARVLDNERRLAEGEDRFTLPEMFGRLAGSGFRRAGRGGLGRRIAEPFSGRSSAASRGSPCRPRRALRPKRPSSLRRR